MLTRQDWRMATIEEARGLDRHWFAAAGKIWYLRVVDRGVSSY